jgi:origin recognition complex subunit 2
VNAPLLWDFALLDRFGWVWHDATSFAPYRLETAFAPAVVGAPAESRARSIQYVLQSLTPNHRNILALLAKRQLVAMATAAAAAAHKADGAQQRSSSSSSSSTISSSSSSSSSGDGGSDDHHAQPIGLTFEEWFSASQDQMLVVNDTAFRAHLQELLDHDILQHARSGSGPGLIES